MFLSITGLVLASWAVTLPNSPMLNELDALKPSSEETQWNREVEEYLQWEHQVVEDYFTELTRSRDITRAVMTWCDEFDIPYTLAFALARKESSFNPRDISFNATSVDRGLFQLNSKSFPFLSEEECLDPWVSAEHGLGYLRYCWNRGGNATTALAMYNAGPTQVERVGTPTFTMGYIHKIYAFQDIFEEELSKRLVYHPQPLRDSGKTVKNLASLMEQS